jgi:hypothetical protein
MEYAVTDYIIEGTAFHLVRLGKVHYLIGEVWQDIGLLGSLDKWGTEVRAKERVPRHFG